MDIDFKKSQYRLRQSIGSLGMALPVLLLLYHNKLLPSMSHYYYSSAGVFFIGILSSLCIILYSYKGHPKSKEEIISDDLVTKLASLFILLTILIPTECEGAISLLDKDKVCYQDTNYLFGYYENGINNTIHLMSAGAFIFLLGYMSYIKFTRNKSASKSLIWLYKICGL